MKALVRLAASLALLAGCESNVNDGGVPFALTERASLSQLNGDPNDLSLSPDVSGDGRVVVFVSQATNLVPGVTVPEFHVYARDFAAGTTILVSRSPAGAPGNSTSISPVVSADGRYVAFNSSANNLVPGLPNAAGAIFRADLVTGTIERVSVSTSNGDTTGTPLTSVFERTISISADGRYVAFIHGGDNLVSPAPSALDHAYRRDMTLGTTIRLNRDAGGGEPGTGVSDLAMSGDGRYVAFTSTATDLVNPAEGTMVADIYLADAQGGPTVRVSNDLSNGEPNGASLRPRISFDGAYVAFQSQARDMVMNDSPTNDTEIYRWTRATGAIVRCSVKPLDSPATGMSAVGARFPSMSADGRYVAFESQSAALVRGDVNDAQDIFVRDMDAGTTLLVSVATFGAQTERDAVSEQPALSADGRFLVFTTKAFTLIKDDLNDLDDIYRRGPIR